MPILLEIKKKMVPEKTLLKERIPGNKQGNKSKQIETLDSIHENDFTNTDGNNSQADFSGADLLLMNDKKQVISADMKNILGYLNQGEWT